VSCDTWWKLRELRVITKQNRRKMALDAATCHDGTLFYVCCLCNSLTEGGNSDVLIYYVVSENVEA
jgi:hypothetical protein